jgi:hypothetical protein
VRPPQVKGPNVASEIPGEPWTPPDPAFLKWQLGPIAGFALGLSGLRTGSRPAIGRDKVGIIERKIECIEGLGISPAGEHQLEN